MRIVEKSGFAYEDSISKAQPNKVKSLWNEVDSIMQDCFFLTFSVFSVSILAIHKEASF